MDAATPALAPFILVGHRHQVARALVDRLAGFDRFALHAATRGPLRLVVAGRERLLRPDSLVLAGPRTPVELHPARGSHRILIEADLTPLPRVAGAKNAWIRPPGGCEPPDGERLLGRALPIAFEGTAGAAGARRLAEVADLWWRSPLARLRANALLHLLIADVLAGTLGETVPDDPDEALCRRYETEAERHLEARATVASLAALLGVARSTLDEAWRTRRGGSPGAHLRARRLATAETLLRREWMGNREIALRVGYADADAFARAFRRAHGCSPQAWRARTLAGR